MRNPRIAAQRLARTVSETPYEQQPEVFYSGLREAELGALPAFLGHTPSRLFSEAFAVLYTLGRASVPLTAGFTMHSYVTSAIITAPPLESLREAVADRLKAGKLVAVSSYGDQIQKSGVPKREVVLRRQEGRWLAKGRKVFNTMATEADFIFFAADDPERGLCLFLAPIKDNPAIKYEALLFKGAMLQSDTRMLDYDDLAVEPEMVLSAENDLTYDLLHYASSWFEALLSGTYLGAASAALEEARKFARDMVTPYGCRLGEMSGVSADLGRLHLLLDAGVARAQRYAAWLDRLDPENFSQQALTLLEEASSIKYISAKLTEQIVSGVRGLVGTRAMAPGSLLHRLQEQSQFAQLFPLIAPVIERDMGVNMMGADTFVGLDDFGG